MIILYKSLRKNILEDFSHYYRAEIFTFQPEDWWRCSHRTARKDCNGKKGREVLIEIFVKIEDLIQEIKKKNLTYSLIIIVENRFLEISTRPFSN